jgi:hypothetical protein
MMVALDTRLDRWVQLDPVDEVLGNRMSQTMFAQLAFNGSYW